MPSDGELAHIEHYFDRALPDYRLDTAEMLRRSDCSVLTVPLTLACADEVIE